MNPRRFITSFRDAWRGLVYTARHEQNFRFQIVAALIVLGIIIFVPLDTWERVVLLLLVAMVLAAELLNTMIEHVSDVIKPRLHHYVGIIKDIMAALVLLTAITAMVVGTLILWPHFWVVLK